MKKILFISLMFLFCLNSLEAQLKLDLKLKREIVAKSQRNYIDAERLVIASVLASDSIFLADEEYTCKQYDILVIFDRSYTTGIHSDMLLVNNSEWTILSIYQPYSDIIKKVLEYFEVNDNIDKRLLPIYIQKITKRFLTEKFGNDQTGPWHDWLLKRPQDTIALQYGKYMDLNLFRNSDLDGDDVVEEKASNIFKHIWNYYFED